MSIQNITALISAAKKHHTEVRYWVKNMIVIKQDNDISIPNKWVLFILDTKSGVMEVIKYKINATNVRIFGDCST